jgi:hypothetical protein
VTRTATIAACAALVASVACGRNADTPVDTAQGDRSATTDQKSTREANDEMHRAVTLEGCLQQGTGTFNRGYLLTMVNQPSSVGTAGSVTATGSSVEREQLRMAASTYRLSAKDEIKLSDMVGKRIRVSGNIAEEAEVPNGAGRLGSDRDTQIPNRDTNPQRDRNPRLDVTELAKVDVASAVVVDEGCTR